MLVSQVVEDRSGLRQEPAIVLAENWHGAGRVDGKKLLRAMLHPDGVKGAPIHLRTMCGASEQVPAA
jgi:hypothetical protein